MTLSNPAFRVLLLTCVRVWALTHLGACDQNLPAYSIDAEVDVEIDAHDAGPDATDGSADAPGD